MSRLDLNVGDALTIDGNEHVVVRRLPGGRLQLEHRDTSEPLVISDAELLSKWADGKVALKIRQSHDRFGEKVATRTEQMRRDFEALDEKSKLGARRKLVYVKGVLAAEPTSLTQANVQPLIPAIAASLGEHLGKVPETQVTDPYVVPVKQRRAPSASSVCRWIGFWQRSGEDIRVLVEATHRRGNRKRRLDQEVIDAIDYYVREVFMHRPRSAARDVWANVVDYVKDVNKGRAKAEGIAPPSLKAIHRAIASLDKRAVALARLGRKQAGQLYDPVGKSPMTKWPLQRVEIDHTRLDVLVVDERTNLPIGRPTLTILVDVYSRMIVGWHIGFDPPGCTAVAHALRHAILPKHYVKSFYPDIKGDYVPCGRPYELVCDIGAEFLSLWFVDACNQLGIHLTYCPGGSPKTKGHVERGIGTLLKDFIHKIPGTTFSNTAAKGDYDSNEMAVVTRTDLDYLTHLWIIAIYSRSEHRGLRDVPERAWDEGVARHPVTMPPQVGDLNALLSKVENRTLQRTGIEYMGLRFNDEQVATLLRRHGSGHGIRIRVDPDDMDHIYVHDPLENRYLDVPSVEPEYTRGLTLAQHKVIAENCRKRISDYIKIEDLCAARVRLQKVVADIFRSRKGRRSTKAALFLGVGGPNAVRDAQERSVDYHAAGNSAEVAAPPAPAANGTCVERAPTDLVKTRVGSGEPRPSEPEFDDEPKEDADMGSIDLDAELAARGWMGD